MLSFCKPIRRLIGAGNDAVEQVRIKILLCALLLSSFTPAAVTSFFLQHQQPGAALRTCFDSFLFAGLLILLVSGIHWRRCAHLSLLFQTLIIWGNALLFKQDLHLIALQFTLLVILCSFFLLGKKWGLVYSLINLSPAVWHISLYTTPAFPGPPVKSGLIAIILLVNFAFIIFAHYHFFNAFTDTIHTLNQRTKQLNDTIKALESSRDGLRQQTRLQKKLIAAITHDIKSPLKYLMLTGRSLYRNRKLRPENLQESIRAIYASSFQMYHFTNNLLQYAGLYLEDSRIVMTHFNLYELVNEKIAIFREMTLSQNNHVYNNIYPRMQVYTNKELLTVIVHNLLDNAIKYTVNGQISFSAIQTERKLEICLKDTGTGMPPDLVDWCNSRQTIRDFITESGGQGLGLAMVKELVGVIQGSLSVKSDEGEGTTIILMLPAEQL
ncbi:sensor histidine kinase [Filimonas effusa]|uniref:histidine kinase n=1 Tax=Filimonas effusa TaxID=2508721 RepID=A0A4Q1DA70_9BACT|nr:HAMP domain-containing sensor histidine kinase [Filimonas effusa]RXK85655.1 HAMP domain-containing histidine kinase [Filimonas effusa]